MAAAEVVGANWSEEEDDEEQPLTSRGQAAAVRGQAAAKSLAPPRRCGWLLSLAQVVATLLLAATTWRLADGRPAEDEAGLAAKIQAMQAAVHKDTEVVLATLHQLDEDEDDSMEELHKINRDQQASLKELHQMDRDQQATLKEMQRMDTDVMTRIGKMEIGLNKLGVDLEHSVDKLGQEVESAVTRMEVEPPAPAVVAKDDAAAGSEEQKPAAPAPEGGPAKRQLNYVEVNALDGNFRGSIRRLNNDGSWRKTLLRGAKQHALLPLETCLKRSKSPGLSGDNGAYAHVTGQYSALCAPLRDTLKQKMTGRIHIFSVDAEGAEWSVLSSLDWERPPCMVVVEFSGVDEKQDEVVRQLLRSKGYNRSSWNHIKPCKMDQFCMLGNEVHELQRQVHGCRPLRFTGQGAPEKNLAPQPEHERAKRIRNAKADVESTMLMAATEKKIYDTCGFQRAQFLGQGMEDILLLEHFFMSSSKCARKGVYVEIGALDGLFLSNTKFFEESLGWTGALIEAVPKNSEKLKENRPKNKIFPFAACPEGMESVTFVGDGGTGGIASTMSEGHRHVWNKGKSEYTVPCKPLGKMLREAGFPVIDLFSLDVEEAEFEVLQTMDWSIPVCVWVVEFDGQKPEKEQAVRDLFQEKGYAPSDWNINLGCQALIPSRKGDCRNEVFVSKDIDSCGVRKGLA